MKCLFISFVVFLIIHYHHEVETVHRQPFLNNTEAVRQKRASGDDAPNEFTIALRHLDEITSIKFSRIQRSLANEHLIVWNARKGFDHAIRYSRVKNVMCEVGPIVFYHGELDSTAVFFVEHGLLNGYVGTKYVIKNLPWEHKDDIHEVGGPHVSEGNAIVEAMIPSRSDSVRQRLRPPRNPSKPREIQNFYSELLVVLDNGLFKEYSANPPLHLSGAALVVYHMLAKFHAADMLFHDTFNPVLHLNLAAIVIEMEPGTLPMPQTGRKAGCVNFPDHEMLYSYQKNFFMHDEIFPPDSFDIVVVMTKHMVFSKGEILEGLAFSTASSVVAFRKQPCLSVPFLTMIHSSVDNVDFAAISHQIANILIYGYYSKNTVSVEDKSSDDICRLHVIRDVEKIMCEGCLSWSRDFSHKLRYFSDSMNACIFMNTPRSLSPKGPAIKLSKEQQCRCYGHPTTVDDYLSCQNGIKCSDSGYSQLPLPFDGTPCGEDKVCWHSRCVDVLHRRY